MSMLPLSVLADLVEGQLIGPDATFDSVNTDTRTIAPGALFVALRGPNFDGHDYLDSAFDKGAAAAMVEVGAPGRPCVQVADTRLGLGRMARQWRLRCEARVVGITGSNGKTTLKEMIAAILATQGKVLATRGNLNNDIGVPLTLCRLRDEAFAVIEMGANHPGEIDYLSGLARPDIAVLNNAGRAHLEGFGSVAGVARAKAEIINGLGDDGVFVFNADDAYADLWRELAVGRRQRTFGVVHPADVSSPAADYSVVWQGGRFDARFPVISAAGQVDVQLPLAGEHNRMNALAAIAASLEAGATLAGAAEALSTIRPVAGRLCPVVGVNGARLIDDSYNANPDSVVAALSVLAAAPGRRTLVLGDLGELGADAAALHRQLGERIAAHGVDRLLTVGELSAAAAEHFDGEHKHYAARGDLAAALASNLSAEDSVLIKGSRAARLDEVVEALREREVAC